VSGRQTAKTRASFASDSQLAGLLIATEAEIAALTAQPEAAQLEPTLPPESGSALVLQPQ
jgi:hypothetical protein